MKKRHSAEQIVVKLREADVDLGKGVTVPEVCKQMGISQQTCYRWRTKYGGMDPLMAKQLREMEKQNSRLKKVVADQALDIQILKEPPAQIDRPRAATSDGRSDASWLGA